MDNKAKEVLERIRNLFNTDDNNASAKPQGAIGDRAARNQELKIPIPGYDPAYAAQLIKSDSDERKEAIQVIFACIQQEMTLQEIIKYRDYIINKIKEDCEERYSEEMDKTEDPNRFVDPDSIIPDLNGLFDQANKLLDDLNNALQDLETAREHVSELEQAVDELISELEAQYPDGLVYCDGNQNILMSYDELRSILLNRDFPPGTSPEQAYQLSQLSIDDFLQDLDDPFSRRIQGVSPTSDGTLIKNKIYGVNRFDENLLNRFHERLSDLRDARSHRETQQQAYTAALQASRPSRPTPKPQQREQHHQQPEEDAFKALEISRTSDFGEVRKAYYALAEECHPDRDPSPDAKERFQKIQSAYEQVNSQGNLDKYLDEHPQAKGLSSEEAELKHNSNPRPSKS